MFRKCLLWLWKVLMRFWSPMLRISNCNSHKSIFWRGEMSKKVAEALFGVTISGWTTVDAWDHWSAKLCKFGRCKLHSIGWQYCPRPKQVFLPKDFLLLVRQTLVRIGWLLKQRQKFRDNHTVSLVRYWVIPGVLSGAGQLDQIWRGHEWQSGNLSPAQSQCNLLSIRKNSLRLIWQLDVFPGSCCSWAWFWWAVTAGLVHPWGLEGLWGRKDTLVSPLMGFKTFKWTVESFQELCIVSGRLTYMCLFKHLCSVLDALIFSSFYHFCLSNNSFQGGGLRQNYSQAT